jgi:hypothetical protein
MNPAKRLAGSLPQRRQRDEQRVNVQRLQRIQQVQRAQLAQLAQLAQRYDLDEIAAGCYHV